MEEEIRRLQDLVTSQREHISQLTSAMAELQAENALVRERNERLEDANADLKLAVSSLGTKAQRLNEFKFAVSRVFADDESSSLVTPTRSTHIRSMLRTSPYAP